jgi:hypothetical protein
VFAGPPENTRDHVLCAARALALGDWETAAKLVLNLELWALIPGVTAATGEPAGEEVKRMLAARVKVRPPATSASCHVTVPCPRATEADRAGQGASCHGSVNVSMQRLRAASRSMWTAHSGGSPSRYALVYARHRSRRASVVPVHPTSPMNSPVLRVVARHRPRPSGPICSRTRRTTSRSRSRSSA